MTAVPDAVEQLSEQRPSAPDRRAVHRHHLLARTNTGFKSRCLGLNVTQHRLNPANTCRKQNPVRHQRKQEVSGRTCGSNGHSLQGCLAVERHVQLVIRYITFTLVQHFDVTAKRQRGNHKFRPFFRLVCTGPDDCSFRDRRGRNRLHSPRIQRLAKANTEPENFYAEIARYHVVTEFVESHQDAQGDNQGKNVLDYSHRASFSPCYWSECFASGRPST